MTTVGYPLAAEGRAQRGPAAGLVERGTSDETYTRQETGHYLRSHCYRDLDRQRRVRRMRRVVVRSADAARASAERGGRRASAVFVTLTYRPGVLWHARQLSECIKSYRYWCNRRGVAVRYQWVLELTRAGVPHYHLLLWVPRGLSVPKPDKAGWWPHGLTRVERARRPVGYLVKYTSKGLGDSCTGEIPRGARLFGCANVGDERHEVKRARLPAWLEGCTAPEQLPRRVARVGYVCELTGTVYRSPYAFDVIRGADGRCVIVFIERGTS